ncbi:hypothetical protein [Streptomyces sp. MK37H]|uniref:hypothetical protein n=1 Tax=Streptomyces sp. MK37H TaxID=2699117 RepID=UPI001FFBBD1B|nr:hypothetical protein [Streptomyces sp. MK37H]
MHIPNAAFHTPNSNTFRPRPSAGRGRDDKASAIAHKADNEGTTLCEAALASGDVTAEDFDRIADPAAMVGPAERRG